MVMVNAPVINSFSTFLTIKSDQYLHFCKTCGILLLITNKYKPMKNTPKALFMVSAVLLSTLSVFAAGQADLYNGGFGQPVAKPDSFGVAVCNRGANALTGAVPVDLAVNGHTAQILSAASIASGKCEYSYLAYGDLGMQAGQGYSVSVVVNHGDQSTYDVTVPGAEVMAAAKSTQNQNSGTANASQQSGNIFSMMLRWFLNLFGK